MSKANPTQQGITRASEAQSLPVERSGMLPRVEIAACMLLTVFLVVCHFRLQQHAGALWRDEVNSVNYTSLSSWWDIWGMYYLDSFPIVWPTVLRLWIDLGFGESDAALRGLGLLVGLGILGMLWWTVRQLGGRVPLISVALFAFNPTTLIYGDSLRAYGVGIITELFMVGTMWAVVQSPTWRRIALAQAAALLAAHTVYANSVMLLAAGVAGAAVGLQRRNWKVVLAPLAIGLVTAFSMCYYLPLWSNWFAPPTDYGYSWFLGVFSRSLSMAGSLMPLVWLVAGGVSLFACGHQLLRQRPLEPPHPGPPVAGRQDLALFLAIIIIVSFTGNFLFWKQLGLVTEIWYYLALMALLAVSFDAALRLLTSLGKPLRFFSLGVCGLATLMAMGNLSRTADHRFTNIDQIAALLQNQAGPEDLIVVSPWFGGLTFARYYQGSTPWITLPDLGKERSHPFLGHHDFYYQFKDKMLMGKAPIQRELDRVAGVLRSGHRVWLVGGLHFLRPGETVGEPPPAATDRRNEIFFLSFWSRQMAFVVQTTAKGLKMVPVPSSGNISFFENFPLWVAE